jgi:hypothetical protein
MKRALALVERDMRKFRRSPALLFASLVLPLVQLIILGNAFGGNIKNVNVGVVNLDRGPESVDVLERRPRGGRQCPHLPAHRLRRPKRRHRRSAEGRAGRRFDHSRSTTRATCWSSTSRISRS